jgi:hypothetical protein
VLLVADITNRDVFDRLLRYVYLDGLFVNEEMVRAGMARAVRYPPDTAMAQALSTAEEEAQAAGIGVWVPATTAPPTTVFETPTTEASSCHPSYRGACVPFVSDVDCAGGSGNGPYYVGRVEVVGPDVYDLDRDRDGVGCEG